MTVESAVPSSTSNADSESVASGGNGGEGLLVSVLLSLTLALAAFGVFESQALFGRPLVETPELRVADVSREMLRSGDYLLPTLGGAPRLKKPPMPYWLTTFAAKAIFRTDGNDPRIMAQAVQLVPALSAALAVLAAALAGCIFWGRTSGLIAGLVLASCELCMRFAQIGYCDATLMCFCAVAACAFSRMLSPRGEMLAALLGGAALGLAILTKGHVPLALLAAPLLIEAIWRRESLRTRNYLYAGGALLLALAIAAPWFYLVEQRHPGAWRELTSEAEDAIKQPDASADSDAGAAQIAHGHRQNDRWRYYFYKGAYGLLPWTPLALMLALALLSTLRLPSRIKRALDPHLRFFLIYALAGFLIFLLVEKKQDYYLLPLLPAAALVLGKVLGGLNAPGGFVEERMGWMQLALGVFGATLLAVMQWWPAGLEWLRGRGIGTGGYLAGHAAEFTALLAPYAAGLALGFFLLNLYCARQWVNGRALSAVLAVALLALGGKLAIALRPSEWARNHSFWKSIERRNKTQTAAEKNQPLFAPGLDDAFVLFYTGRKQRPLRELAGDEDESVTLLVQGSSLKKAALELKLDPAAFPDHISADVPKEALVLMTMYRDNPQLLALREALRTQHPLQKTK